MNEVYFDGLALHPRRSLRFQVSLMNIKILMLYIYVNHNSVSFI